MLFQNKVAVITGAARGIGLAYARRFAEDGANIVIADVRDDLSAVALDSLAGLPGRAVYRHCDVTRKDEVQALMDASVDEFGRLDFAVANAGIVTHGDFLTFDEADFDRTVDVNLTGVFLTGQAAAQRMVKLGNGGAIVNVSSVNALVASPETVAYCSTKAGVVMLTKVMAISLADHGIRVNAIGPGPTRTEMEARSLGDPEKKRIREIRTPLRRYGEPEEQANVVAFLCSEDAGYITGQTLYVEGGRLCLNYMMPDRD